MTSSLLSRKLLSSFLLTSFVVMASPISAIYAAAVIAEVTPIPTPSNNTTPSYTFSSDAVGSINYTGLCSSSTTITVVGNNTITLNPLTDGTYNTCTIDVDDGFGLSNVLTISTFVIDTTAPVVTLVGSGTLNIFTGPSYTDSGASWIDNIDGTGNTLVGIYGNSGSFQSSGSVNITQSGTYTIEYLKVDTLGNTGSATRTVNVFDADVTPPVVTLVGSGTINMLSGATFSDSGATWTDNFDGTGTILAYNSGSLNTAATGTYTIGYYHVDVAGNTGSVTRTVNVTTGNAPVITLVGSGTISVLSGSVYTDSGATASDIEDGDITPSIVASGSVNTSVVGTYTIRYDVTDSHSNIATQVTRTVNVIAGNAPVITLVGSGTINVLSGSVYTDSGATASDVEDGDVTPSIVASGSVNTSVVGTYTITYNVTDSQSNAATQVTRTVNVTTGNAPVITLVGSGTISIISGSVYTDSGATASDVEDGNLTSSITVSGSVNTSVVGTYTITYNVTDSQSNAATQVTRTVNVNAIVDTTPPVITLIGPSSITINVGSTYTDAGASWTDNIDGSGTVVATGLPNTTIVGTYTLSYDKTDAAGNTGTTVNRTVSVRALANISFVMVGGGGAAAGGGSNNSSADTRVISMNAASSSSVESTEDEMIPSIERLLRKFLEKNNEKNHNSAPEVALTLGENQLRVIAPITDYICPVVDQFYDMDDEQVANVSEGEFTPDVQALLMYRSTANTQSGINYSSRYLMNNGFGVASNNESYDGDRAITRAEFVKMLVRALSCHYVPTTATTTFSDVGLDAWYTEYITFATEQRWIRGYRDGTFRPHDPITRGEAAQVLAQAIRVDVFPLDYIEEIFSDVPVESSFAHAIYSLRALGVISGKTGSSYDMERVISRNEVARLFHNTFLNLE